jgi:hypothetical protein
MLLKGSDSRDTAHECSNKEREREHAKEVTQCPEEGLGLETTSS